MPTNAEHMQMRIIDLGFWTFDFPVNANVDVGVQTVPPFGIFALGPTVRLHKSFSDKIHVGIYGTVGYATVFVNDDNRALFGGGGPIFTWGDARANLNVSFLTYAGVAEDNSSRADGYVLVPSVSGSMQLGSSVKIILETFSFNAPEMNSNGIGKAWAVLYGIRIFGDQGKMFGDIGFIAPIGPEMGELYQVAPLGIPLFSFGVNF